MKKPKILIDLGKLKNLYTGLGQISLQYGNALVSANYTNIDLTFFTPSEYTGKFGESVKYQTLSTCKRYFPVLYNFPHRFNLWHAIHQDSGYMPPKGIPYLLTIHDLNFLQEKSPAKASFRLRSLQKKVNQATAITFISNFSESVARQYLKIQVPAYVIYNGVNIPVFVNKKKPEFLENVPGASNSDLPVYFTVGVIKEKKNFHVLIDFFKRIQKGILVIAGDNSDAYASLIYNQIYQAQLQDRIIMPGMISDNDRAWLYENCTAFLFPSKIEGFGLPVIEAMSYGKPVFLSTCSSLPEVGGNDAYYWENFNPDFMASVFNENMKSATIPEKIQSRKKRAAMFNWENAVAQYLALYENIINNKL